MTSYTNHQIMQALGARGFAADTEDVAAIAQDLGITVEEPKPEPGIYLHDDGTVHEVYGNGAPTTWTCSQNSDWLARNRDKLTPARVVTEDEWSEHGRGATMPSRGQVREALAASWLDWSAVGRPISLEAHTDAVMALLPEGGKA